jgi:hypothetical protein
MKKISVAILVCVFVLSFSGLTTAGDKPAEAKPAAPPAADKPAEVKPAATPAADKSAASPDDMKWIAQCIMDNKDEGQPMEVVQKYCECMNSKMDDNENLSVTEWEKKHPQEEKECSEKSGWK